MGEYADMAVDDCLDADLNYNLVDFEDWQSDPYFHYSSGRWRGFRSRPKTCKRCGTSNLWWGNHDGNWKLETSDGKIHQCSHNFKAQLAALRKEDPYMKYLDTIPWPTEADFNS